LGARAVLLAEDARFDDGTPRHAVGRSEDDRVLVAVSGKGSRLAFSQEATLHNLRLR
jgi:hypothetical protein